MKTNETSADIGVDTKFGRVVRAPQIAGSEIADNGKIHMGGFCQLLPPAVAAMMGCP